MDSKKLLRNLLIILIVLIIFAVVGKKTGFFGKEISYKVVVDTVKLRDITEVITANGKIQPETEVKINPEISGEIVELYVKDGDVVKQGQLLLRIKPDLYMSARDRVAASVDGAKANLANARAQLVQVEAQFEQARLSYERNQKLWNEGVISEAEWESAQSAYKIAKANVESAKQTVIGAEYSIKSAVASLNEANEKLTKASIFAPMSGTISALYIEKGQRVAGTELMTGTDLLTIADLGKMELLVEVNENDIVRVEEADTALIEVDAYLDRKFKGVVTQIANSAKTTGMTTDQVTNFEVKILLLEESYKDLLENRNSKPFLPGMSASADIMTEKKTGVLSVPIQAVTTRTDSVNISDSLAGDGKAIQKEVVFIYDNGKAVQKVVKTGIQDNTYIEITEGISENEFVIADPFDVISRKLKDGSLVDKVTESELYKKKKKNE
ncbi:MAG: efflux RND transporter periplasmic adaptor subunit [Bacteroidales bacterium]|nr:efflux RND transporter periplasmic adaptor subunit [Bacteroidales bacterium]